MSPVSASVQLPPELASELSRLEGLFTVDRQKLKTISTRFAEELQEGLEKNGSNIPMNITWVLGFPSGEEKGSFLTLDLGGTNLRVCWIHLTEGKGGKDVTQEQYRLPDDLKSSDADTLWDFTAGCFEKFVKDQNLQGSNENPLPLGFTFSYPATQDYIDHGVLQTWTKGLDISGCEGEDAATQLRDAMAKRKLPIKLIALINDTTGAMIASAYSDPGTIIGAIFGTGCNAAYMDHCGNIPKIEHLGMPPDTPMAINCEYGAFDNALRVLPRTAYDDKVDAESPRPGEQSFEKLSAGLYLGEIFRLVLCDLHTKGVMFPSQDTSKLQQAYVLDTGFLSAMEENPSLDRTAQDFKARLELNLSEAEVEFCHRLARLVALRGARLCACGVASICRRKGTTQGNVAADGSVASKSPTFKQRWGQALGEILDWEEDRTADPIRLSLAEDGSGLGAAVIAAMTMERANRGNSWGIKEKY